MLLDYHCKICNSIVIKDIYKNVYKCSSCNNAFRIKYSNNIKDIYKSKITMPNYLDNFLKNRHHYNFIKNYLDDRKDFNIIDIGCGNGSLLKYIRKRNKNISITALEPGILFRKELIKIDNINIIEGFVEDTFDEQKYDLVIMSHVLEHLEDPINILQTIRDKYLKKGGILYIDVPNSDFELRSYETFCHSPAMHLFFYDAGGLLNEIYKIDYELLQCEKYKSVPDSFIYFREEITKKNKLIKVIVFKIIIKFSKIIYEVYNLFLKSNYKIGPYRKFLNNYNNIAMLLRKK